MPSYEAAIKTLQCLDAGAIFELKSYIAPPQIVIEIMKAICLLFDEDMSLVLYEVDLFNGGVISSI